MQWLRMTVPAVTALALLALTPPALACSSCGCTLNSDWSSQGYTTRSGWNLDLRFDEFDQRDLRSGVSSVDRAALALPNEREVQQDTRNHNTTLGLDYSPDRRWGVSLSVPWLDRWHSTIAPGDADISTSASRGLGDARLLARYQGFQEDLSIGVQAGLKLPTGRIDDRFRSGPQAGELVDRGLQLGTGTTDLLLGAYTAGNLGAHVAYFGSLLWQQPLASRDGFRPGAGANVSLGVRYTTGLWGRVTPQLQLNARIEGRESGINADVANSGATLVYLSPGVGIRLGARLDGFLFAQVPIYQHVNGLQIEPRFSASLGLRYRF
jgi:hypothetical protein